MQHFHLEGISVKLYTDPVEFCKYFNIYPTEDAVLDTDNLPESAGFSYIPDKEIYINARADCSFSELFRTVAHEVGHLIEGGFKKNPPDTNRYFKRHEQKAEHYENFAMQSYNIAVHLYQIINQQEEQK